MKLPKNFGGQGFGNMLKQAQDAMAQASNIEESLKHEMFEVDKGPVKAVFDGTGLLYKIKIDPAIVDPEDVETLEDLVVSTMRDVYERAVAIRNQRIEPLLKNMPDIPGVTQ